MTNFFGLRSKPSAYYCLLSTGATAALHHDPLHENRKLFIQIRASWALGHGWGQRTRRVSEGEYEPSVFGADDDHHSPFSAHPHFASPNIPIVYFSGQEILFADELLRT